MRLRLIQVTRRKSGRESRRESQLEGELLALGRGSDCDLELVDLSVALRHAELLRKGDGVYLRPVGRSELSVSGQRCVGERRLAVGDVVRIGPFELRAIAAEAGFDLALEVEQMARREDARGELAKRSRLTVEGGWFSRRTLSFAGVAVVLLGFLVLPLALGRAGSWSSGPLSHKHSFAADDCGECHTRAFATVENGACLDCHAEIGNHSDSPALAAAGMTGAACTDCHSEHAGEPGLLARAQDSCAGCHTDLSQRLEQPRVANASDFAADHPEFQLAMLDPATRKATPVGWQRDLEERSGVAFSHARHVGEALPEVPERLRSDPARKSEPLRCSSCHQLEAGGQRMQPIEFEKHCQACHQLGFDAALPDDQAPHAKPVELREGLRRLYAAQVVAGNAAAVALPEALRFRIPGSTLSDQEQSQAQGFVDARVRRAEHALYVEPGECARCHALERDAPAASEESGAGEASLAKPPSVPPVYITERWMPQSMFRHATHAPFPCADCHPAAAAYLEGGDAENPRPEWSLPEAGPFALRTEAELQELGLTPSKLASDLLIPGIEQCRGCHGGENARPPEVASECSLCHRFHRAEHGPMQPGGAARPSPVARNAAHSD